MKGIAGNYLLGLMPGTAIVVPSNAPATIREAALEAKAHYGNLIQLCDGVADEYEIETALGAAADVKLMQGQLTLSRRLAIDNMTDKWLHGSGDATIITPKTQTSTTLTQVVNIGDNHIHVVDASGFVVGEDICIFNGVATYEVRRITSIVGTQINTGIWANGFNIGDSVYSAFTVVEINAGTRVKISDLTIDGNKTNWPLEAVACSYQYGMAFNQGSYNSAHNVTFRNGVRAGLGVRNDTFTIVSDCLFYDNDGADFFFQSDVTGSIISNCSINTSSFGIDNENARYGCIIGNNIRVVGAAVGIRLYSTAYQMSVIGNNIRTANAGAIGISLTNPAYDNDIVGNNLEGGGLGSGIILNGAGVNSNTVSGNSISNFLASVQIINGASNTFIGNNVSSFAVGGYGLYVDSADYTAIVGNTIKNTLGVAAPGIGVNANYCTIVGNTLYGAGSGVINQNGLILRYANKGYHTVVGNTITAWRAAIDPPSLAGDDSRFAFNVLQGNNWEWFNALSPTQLAERTVKYIAPGETQTMSGPLTAGVAGAICFAWNNPYAQDILIKKVVIEVTTAGGTLGSHLDVGIADDAAGTNRGTEFFDDLLLNSAQVNDSYLNADGGQQTKWVLCQDYVSAVDDWIVGQILDANAASLVGRYYIEYTGR